MGLYFRKSVGLGPIRLNFSKSGVGVSAGVKGFRVGTGPRGNYLHMGRNGLYSGTTLPSATAPVQSVPEMREIDSGSVAQMVNESSIDLLAAFQERRRLLSFFPFALALAVVGLPILFVVLVGSGLTLETSGFATLSASVVCLVNCVFARRRDAARKTITLTYDLEPRIKEAVRQLHTAFDRMARCAAVWHVRSQGSIWDRKRNSGASSQIARAWSRPSRRLPRFLKANIDIPTLQAGAQTLVFLPDRLLVIERNGSAGAVMYSELSIQTNMLAFHKKPHHIRTDQIISIGRYGGGHDVWIIEGPLQLEIGDGERTRGRAYSLTFAIGQAALHLFAFR